MLRRILARRIREKTRAIWPINQSTKNPPPGWSTWPNGVKFAFVLTHDVEGPEGLAKCRQLAELEISFGVRSSFNFVPEGSYSVPNDLIDWLTDNGFEVGVHDLHHDGKLFSSRESFKDKAIQINQYLSSWKAKGYRSGFMLRNLGWLHDLNITYDASTFDTDPFEPQPDGAGTIFPYWIPAPQIGRTLETGGSQVSQEVSKAHSNGNGYVELPYTLAQDSTLFLVLKETSPSIWFEKADWVATQGGMVLVNVHPDYINFDSRAPTTREYPVSHYKALLEHIIKRHAGTYWNPLPWELAEWYKRSCNPSSSPSNPPFLPRQLSLAKSNVSGSGKLRGKRAAVLLYSRYPSDPRPRRAAEALFQEGMEIDLFCLAGSITEPHRENVNGVNVTRIPIKHRRDSKLLYFWQYGRFFASSFCFLLTKSLRHRIDLVHIHNMPDFLVFAAIVPKLKGAKIILDLHDPMPELMESIYNLRRGDWKVGLLRILERWSISFCDLAITPNIAFKNLFTSRSCRSDKIEIVMNSPQEDVFDPGRYPSQAPQPRLFKIMHHGSIVHRHGVDILVRAIAKLTETIPGINLDIYGNATPFLDEVMELARNLGVSKAVIYHGAKSQVEIAQAILACDLGVVPNRRSPFIEINFPTRLFEYISLGKPVIAPDTTGIRDYFDEKQIIYFEADNVEKLSEKILWVYRNRSEARKLLEAGAQVYDRHRWHIQREYFTTIVSSFYKQ
jgi:glycosyltransferase involved in cell wall biosynthesis